MALLSTTVPLETAKLLHSLGVAGEPTTDLHITILYPGKDELGVKAALAYIEATHDAIAGIEPFDVEVTRLSTFDPKDGVFPIIGVIDSPELHKLREALVRVYESKGVPYDKKFPVFKPHVTLAFQDASEPREVWEQELPHPLSWMVSEISLWTGTEGPMEGDRNMVVTFPLSMHRRVAARWLQGVRG